MRSKLTDEKILEVAKRYGLEAKKNEDQKGFFVDGDKVNIDDYFEDILPNDNEFVDTSIEISINTVMKTPSRINFCQVNVFFDDQDDVNRVA